MRSASVLRSSGSALARRQVFSSSCVAVHIQPVSAASAYWQSAAHDVLVSNANASALLSASSHSSLALNTCNRWFSSATPEQTPKSDEKEKNSGDDSSEDVIGETDPDTATGVNRTIRMNPDGFSRRILPGSYAMKVNAKTQTERKLLAERVFGYFWMFKDLELTKEKPILGNEGCIDDSVAERFPALGGKNDARGELPITLTDEVVSMPDFCYRNNRAMDPTSQCTLVGLSYREFGNKMLPSWINPFKEALCSPASPRRNRVEVVQISVQEGFALRLLKGMVKSGFRKAVPVEDHERTLLFFGADQTFKDVLRCHNTCTGYVFLLDGIGRIRWAGSGKPTDEEMRTLIEVAKELTPVANSSNAKMKGKPRMNKR